MRSSTLVVDGQDYDETGEGLVVEHFARKMSSHVVRLPFFPTTVRRWSMVWFTGHLTWYRKPNIKSLEARQGSTFYQLATVQQLTKLKATLLVLSTCYGAGKLPSFPGVENLIVHDGYLLNEDALVFASRFMYRISKLALTRDNIRSTFKAASAHQTKWRLL